MNLSLSGWRKLAPLRRQFSIQGGFLFVPLIVADEALAIAVKRSIAETWRANGWALHELAWVEASDNEASRVTWLAGFDAAIAAARPGDTLVVDTVSVVRRERRRIRRAPVRVECSMERAGRRHQATTDFATSASFAKALASRTARSASSLRFTSTWARLSPEISLL